MPRKPLGPRLYLHQKSGRWIIRDGTVFRSTGFKTSEVEQAEAAFARYVRLRQPARTIYFITCLRDDFPVKIGRAIDLNERMIYLSTAMPYQPVLLASFAGKTSDETRLHKQFAHLRLRGEWFRRDPELMDYIASLRKFEVIPEPKIPESGAWRALAMT